MDQPMPYVAQLDSVLQGHKLQLDALLVEVGQLKAIEAKLDQRNAALTKREEALTDREQQSKNQIETDRSAMLETISQERKRWEDAKEKMRAETPELENSDLICEKSSKELSKMALRAEYREAVAADDVTILKLLLSKSFADKQKNGFHTIEVLAKALSTHDDPGEIVLKILESEPQLQVIPYVQQPQNPTAQNDKLRVLRRSFATALEALVSVVGPNSTRKLSEEQSVRAAKIFESWRGTGKDRDGLDAWAILLLMAGFKIESSKFKTSDLFAVLCEVVKRRRFAQTIELLKLTDKMSEFMEFLQEQGKLAEVLSLYESNPEVTTDTEIFNMFTSHVKSAAESSNKEKMNTVGKLVAQCIKRMLETNKARAESDRPLILSEEQKTALQTDLDKLKTLALQAMKVFSPTTGAKRDNSHLAAKKPAAKRDNSYLAAKKPAVKSTRQYKMPTNRYSSSQKNNWQNSSAAPYQMVPNQMNYDAHQMSQNYNGSSMHQMPQQMSQQSPMQQMSPQSQMSQQPPMQQQMTQQYGSSSHQGISYGSNPPQYDQPPQYGSGSQYDPPQYY